jgi:two-component system response regulator
MPVSILVVEDEPSHQELIVESIKEANVLNNIVCMDSGGETISYLKREGQYSDSQKFPKPDLVLLDLKLPGIDGKEVLRFIKSNEETKRIPVIMLTSSARDKDIDECYMLGANSYITKPISFDDFVDKVKKIPLYWILVNELSAVPEPVHDNVRESIQVSVSK